MAYITSEQTKEIRNSLKAAFPRKDGWKFSVRKESGNLEVRVEVLESPLRFSVCDRGYFSLPSWSSSIEDGEYENAEVLRQILDIVNLVGKENANFDKSDSMSEYFHVGYYTTVTIGNYDAPVLYTGLEIEEADVEGLTKYNVHTALRIRSKVNPSIVRELYNTYGDTYKIITKGNSNITIIPSQFKYWEIVELVDLQAQFEKQQKEIEEFEEAKAELALQIIEKDQNKRFKPTKLKVTLSNSSNNLVDSFYYESIHSNLDLFLRFKLDLGTYFQEFGEDFVLADYCITFSDGFEWVQSSQPILAIDKRTWNLNIELREALQKIAFDSMHLATNHEAVARAEQLLKRYSI